jgi:two-component system sensor histidine kinase KdpD
MSNEPIRPNPDELLARVMAEEQQQNRGKLKIFLGYAAGVGKTYAMLDAARQRQAEGMDVVIGYVETHGRPETEALLAGLEVIPRQRIEYRGLILEELDVDAVLARRPQLVLVDELAHTNAPGSRHPKRYQDVLELLTAGSDVYTTLNIQHLESLNNVVAQITGVIVRETVPDSAIDAAAEIELVDIAPDELLQRLKEGKVYVPEQAARAIEKFFRKGNLTALRELTMRRAAERVDEQMRAYMQMHVIPGPWPAKERLLVCISLGTLSERLVRTARRLADELRTEWYALYVETPAHARLSPAQQDRVAHLLRLAEELGGKAVTIPGQAIVETILNFARTHNVTKVIIGKPLRPRWREWLRGLVTDQLLRASGPIDVYVISGEAETGKAVEVRPRLPHRPWRQYLQSIALVIAATLLGFPTRGFIQPTNLVMLYLAVVVIAAVYLGHGPAILASILGVLAFDFFFVSPFSTFAVSDTEYLVTFGGLLAVGLVISELAARMREQAKAAQRREAEMASLYALSRDLAGANNLEAILRAVILHVGETFGREVVVLLPEVKSNGRLEPYVQSPDMTLSENERAVAEWVYRNGQPAGPGTDTLPSAAARYLPLKTAKGIVGVLGVIPKEAQRVLTHEERRLLEAFADQAALAIERAQLAEQASQAQLLQAAEKLQTALLNSISHDLRTPLVSITGALTSLQEEGSALDEEARRNLIETARQEAERLNRLVGNLLDMTRIEAGTVKVTKEPCYVQDVIGAALEHLTDGLKGRPVTVKVSPALPLVPMDFVLIEQVLVNLLDNALRYSTAGTPIEVCARVAGDDLEIEVADRGIGIPPEDLERVFDKFYRVQRPHSVAGTGLGLTISKGFVEAHGGRIWARNRPGGGTIVTLALPMRQVG